MASETQTQKPIVSVIISTYDRPDQLPGAIESVLAQSLKEIEVLVVDDCSPPEAHIQALVAQYPANVRYLRTDKNSGHDSHPKNLGIKAAQGQYVSFLDDDDRYRVDALKILTTYARESQAHVVYGDYMIRDAKKKEFHEGWSVDFAAATLARMNFISMSTAMVERLALLEVGGFDEEVPKFKDWNLWLRLQKSGHKFLHVPIICTHVISQEKSISSKFKVQHDAAGRYLPTFFNPADCLIFPKTTCLGPAKPLKVAIYTLTWNRLAYTKVMAKALAETAGYPFDWFVVDQGSTDGTKEWLQGFEFLKELKKPFVEFNEQNVGLAQGWNQAIDFIKKTGDYDIVVKVDNDAQMLTTDWLKDMVDVLARNSTFILSPYVEGLENSPGGVMRQRIFAETPYIVINDRVLGSVPNIGGIVFANHIRLFDHFRFDPTYQGNKDYILSMFARRNGFVPFYMEEYRVAHIRGTAGQHEDFPEYFQDPSNTSATK